MGAVIKLHRKPRPLTKTYQPKAPYIVERHDDDDGTIRFEVIDERPGSYRRVCVTDDDCGEDPYAKHDAEQIARALNMMVQLNKEQLPQMKDDE